MAFASAGRVSELQNFDIAFIRSDQNEVNWLFNVTINNISVIHVTAHRRTEEEVVGSTVGLPAP